jgi:two-component system sensor histidine kinase/response regulator
MSIQKNSILIVDDNPMNVLLTETILKNNGYLTYTALSGLKAIDLLTEVIPSLILLDVMMPDMDGLQVCRKIKENQKWKDIPIIFLTANTQTEDVVRGFDAGGVDYITKPFKGEELLVRVKNHLELFHSRHTIMEMNKNRDKLYSIIAHDIRSPLSGIQQTIDAIDQGFFDPNTEDFRDLIHQLGIRTRETSTLLNSLLQWTRFQGEFVSIQMKPTNLFLLLTNCVLLLEANARNKDITIKIDLDENYTALCDEVSIHTVFRNILSNAIKFTPNNGMILITSEQNDKYINIVIADTGVGIEEKMLQKILSADELISTSGTNNEQGTGLGLIMVRDFVKKNNGILNITSTLGEGTTIKISLPKA